MPHFSTFDAAAGPPEEQAIAALVATAGLSAEDGRRLLSQVVGSRRFPTATELELEPQGAPGRLIVSGWACENRLLDDARRQIFSFLLPGDILPQQNGRPTPRTMTTLTPVECLEVRYDPASDTVPAEWAVAMATAFAVQRERRYDAILRLGRYTAQERLVHLLLELHSRLKAVGLAEESGFRTPLTQDHLADALGLSLVHVNRLLRQLRDDGTISVSAGMVRFLQPSTLARIERGYAPSRGLGGQSVAG